ncbi:MAG TPA: aminoglycoside phosphotransferase family protein [Candidatus Cloacimonadota bacterium]|nr:aminoglycoside phosphotransferase family protein [Candidatus Cloacimonadota bacterium]HPM01088.1 aminoglycoside phosphotransferase family protein [Candidatus Cloacimonadota bacterium]
MKQNIQRHLCNVISENAKVVNIEKTNEPFKFVRYGRKHFEKLEVKYLDQDKEGSISLILKKYPTLDMPMLLTKDFNYREIQFFSSDIKKTFSRFFDIPILFTDKRTIYMKDCSNELKRFGPPTLPSESQMKNLITRIAIKDAKLTGNNWDHAYQFSDMFDFMNRALNKQLSEKETKHLKQEWKWFFSGLDKLLTQLGSVREEKLKNFYKPEKVKNIMSKVPFTLHHGDFYFANIGFNDDNKPLVIDWEMLCYAPIGYDFVMLTNDIPPLQFTEFYEEWYVEAYNNACDNPLTVKQFIAIAEQIKIYQFLITKTFEMIHDCQTCDDLGKYESDAKLISFIEKLDRIIKK